VIWSIFAKSMKEIRKIEKEKKQRREKYEKGPREPFQPTARTSPRPSNTPPRTGTIFLPLSHRQWVPPVIFFLPAIFSLSLRFWKWSPE
jgi:hypothetical protein